MSQLSNTVLKDCFADERFRPNVIQQLLFGYESSSVIDQVPEYGECFGPEWDLLSVSPEALVSFIEAKRAKQNLTIFHPYENKTGALQLNYDYRSATAYSPRMTKGWQQQRSFVIKFLAADSGSNSFCGRVEHVSSGRVARYDSEDELLEFMKDVLKRLRLEQEDASGGV